MSKFWRLLILNSENLLSVPPKKRLFIKCNLKKNEAIVCSRSSEEKGSEGNEVFSLVFCRKGEKKGTAFIDDYISTQEQVNDVLMT